MIRRSLVRIQAGPSSGRRSSVTPTDAFARLPVDKRRSSGKNYGARYEGTHAVATRGGALQVKVFQAEHQVRTQAGLEIRDITDDVRRAVEESGITDGIVCVYSPHTTCCVRVNEFEAGLLEDFTRLLRRLVPSEKYYAHDDWDLRTENVCDEDMEFGNGHSHCMSLLMGPAGESIPLRDGELCIGTWQRVLFIELDRSRERRWLVQVVGD